MAADSAAVPRSFAYNLPCGNRIYSETNMKQKKITIVFNSPVVLSFAALSLLVLVSLLPPVLVFPLPPVLAFLSLLAASAALYLPQTGQKQRRTGLTFAAAAVVPAAGACITSGCLSPQLVQRTQAPFYAMSKSLNVLGVAERFEPFVSAALLMGFFCLTSLITQSAAEIAQALCPRIPEKWCALGTCLLAGVAALLAGRVPQAVQMGLAAIFWAVLPVVTLAIVAVKKVRKKSKKVLDKRDFLW